jgi:hypothetical protein
MTLPITEAVTLGLPSTDAGEAEPHSADPAAPSPQWRSPAMLTGDGRMHDAAAVGRYQRLEQRGRPTAYSSEIAERILDGLAHGRTLLDICDDEGMPTSRTVHS